MTPHCRRSVRISVCAGWCFAASQSRWAESRRIRIWQCVMSLSWLTCWPAAADAWIKVSWISKVAPFSDKAFFQLQPCVAASKSSLLVSPEHHYRHWLQSEVLVKPLSSRVKTHGDCMVWKNDCSSAFLAVNCAHPLPFLSCRMLKMDTSKCEFTSRMSYLITLMWNIVYYLGMYSMRYAYESAQSASVVAVIHSWGASGAVELQKYVLQAYSRSDWSSQHDNTHSKVRRRSFTEIQCHHLADVRLCNHVLLHQINTDSM